LGITYIKYLEIRGTKELDPGIDRTHIFPKNGSTDGKPGKYEVNRP
jgi:hypothetical protein